MEAEKAVKAAAEVLLVGLRKFASQVFAAFGNKTGQVKQAAGVRLVRRGEVEADFARWLVLRVCHIIEEREEAHGVKKGANAACFLMQDAFV